MCILVFINRICQNQCAKIEGATIYIYKKIVSIILYYVLIQKYKEILLYSVYIMNDIKIQIYGIITSDTTSIST